jgi:hypothetical protein
LIGCLCVAIRPKPRRDGMISVWRGVGRLATHTPPINYPTPTLRVQSYINRFKRDSDTHSAITLIKRNRTPVRRGQFIARNMPSRRKFLCFKLPMVIPSTSSSRAAKSDHQQAGGKTARDTHSAVILLKPNLSPTTHTNKASHSTCRSSRTPKPKPRQ